MDIRNADMELAVADYLIATRCRLEDGEKIRHAFLAGVRWSRCQRIAEAVNTMAGIEPAAPEGGK